MGKGDKRRPTEVSDEELHYNWNLAFKRSKKNVQKNRYKRSSKDAK